MQNYNYHCHNSFENIFDGSSTINEMLAAYKSIGFNEIGLSNHFICHRAIANGPHLHNQNFSDIDKFLDVAKRMFEQMDIIAEKLNIKLYKGFEVDYFFDPKWEKDFLKMKKVLNPDYLIGTAHFLNLKDENRLYNLYHLQYLPDNVSDEEKDEMLGCYWDKQIAAAKSGYFNFMAHPDYCTQFGLCVEDKWKDKKLEFINALKEGQCACEVNTGGLRRNIGRPYPDWWMVKEMCSLEIPLLISDDAHNVKDIAFGFSEVEQKLAEFNCKKRYKL